MIEWILAISTCAWLATGVVFGLKDALVHFWQYRDTAYLAGVLLFGVPAVLLGPLNLGFRVAYCRECGQAVELRFFGRVVRRIPHG